ncbi:uncharacterized protein LOC116852376 [Odontomachus brunneus]|uniref:uncharacterized protein LOC116852376 n=1 Tax=Odontomachus brunneus TaxID=486640 RepID=UPI0013F2ABB0|nr:uncharacterized protein LOC116852376 [Odontomachus brunneus]
MADEEFIRTMLNEWKLSKWYHRFIEEDIDKEAFLNITETEVSRIITTIGGIRCFLKKRKLLIDNIKLKKSRAISDDNKLEQLKSCQQLSRSLTGLPPIYKEKEEISKENFEKVELSCSDSQPSTSYAQENVLEDSLNCSSSTEDVSSFEDDNFNLKECSIKKKVCIDIGTSNFCCIMDQV